MRRWDIYDEPTGRRMWEADSDGPVPPTVGHGRRKVARSDDETIPAYRYEGPHGPAFIAYHDHWSKTRVWGENIPESRLNNGYYMSPPLSGRDRTKALESGVEGNVGDLPLYVHSKQLWGRSLTMTVRLGEDEYLQTTKGLIFGARALLLRPGGGVAVRTRIRTFPGNGMPDDVTPEEVALALLLYCSVGGLRPRNG